MPVGFALLPSPLGIYKLNMDLFLLDLNFKADYI